MNCSTPSDGVVDAFVLVLVRVVSDSAVLDVNVAADETANRESVDKVVSDQDAVTGDARVESCFSVFVNVIAAEHKYNAHVT